jgi:hypothetical protein
MHCNVHKGRNKLDLLNTFFQIKKFPSKIEKREQLAGILTTFIWALTGQHAAVTYPVLEYGGFVPNAPHRLFADIEGNAKFSNSMFGNKAIALVSKLGNLAHKISRYIPMCSSCRHLER